MMDRMIKRKNNLWRLAILISVLLVTGILAMSHAQTIQAAEAGQEITVLFTHDIHSYLAPKDDGTGEKYGLARVATMIEERKAVHDTTILVDGGDFSMGTLYQALYPQEAAELVMLGKLGFDATTLGNHEFNYREEGLSEMLNTAKAKEDTGEVVLPELLLSNLDWSRNTTEENQKLKKAWDNYGAKDYAVIERNGVRIGLFGIFGKDAADVSPLCGLVFEDQIESAKKAVAALEAEQVDLIVCLSHSGTWSDPAKSEDEQLAKAVSGIDVIISGHTHTTLEQPIVIGSTYIVSCGCYGHNLGELSLQRNTDGRYDMKEYHIYPMTADVKQNEKITAELKNYQKDINEKYLSRFGYTYDEVIAHNAVDFISIDDLETKGISEEPLANLIADAYRYGVETTEGNDGIPVDVAIVGKGMIREKIPVGDVKVKDVYDVCALGVGPDGISGYPMVSIWLNGKELEIVAEIDVSISDGGTSQMYPGGIGWSYNPNRLILNRVTEVFEMNSDGRTVPVDQEKLYRVVTPLYCVQMLGTVQDKSKGLLSVTPKNQDGEAITDYENYIIYDHTTGEELKEWETLAMYLESFEPTINDLPEVPADYGELQGRKIMSDSKNLIELMKNPNKISILLYCIILMVLLIIVWIVRFVVYKRKNKKQR